MSRVPWWDGELEYRSFGTPGAPRAVVVLRTGDVSTIDPDVRVTSGFDVRIVAVGLDAPELDDPPAFGGQTPAGLTLEALRGLLEREIPGATVGLVGERSAGQIALHLAAAMGPVVDRLAIVGVESPTDPLSRDLHTPLLDDVVADTLVVVGGAGPAGTHDAEWYSRRIPSARVEVIDAEDLDTLNGHVTLSSVWASVLAHVAPGAQRR
ncbi:MAG: hypothetical protein BGO45_12125 [Microbacterium sp. 71-36]|uniref:hypothetical protein n=1 Tax=unclassified Microbacterium TaxID=2609290 RepID=UPI00086D9940|nr:MULTISPECIES: hypothetical protein [unclassified Microbacterium]MBN9211652.1 hypothetical protein [Microbacterium sp.]ODT37480.1 MAG: hypothetical protein ABS60_13000 [Microbacterium sp. SCN 71-17]ODU51669.1 MAG: hypothetical protein ABT07_02170 [Microbacterium sp. SCN 70-10]OJV77498.1 MAG: hypothetical protein BGO45_12125 [Microbacterium sp. 71-36]